MQVATVSGAGKKQALKDGWITVAQQLDAKGHFQEYSTADRRKVLEKGYLGPCPPDQALIVARERLGNALYDLHPNIVDDLRGWDCVGRKAILETLQSILAEAPPETYEPPALLKDPPGYPFVFECDCLERRIYFKFQIFGCPRKPRVLFWSCHSPIKP